MIYHLRIPDMKWLQSIWLRSHYLFLKAHLIVGSHIPLKTPKTAQ